MHSSSHSKNQITNKITSLLISIFLQRKKNCTRSGANSLEWSVTSWGNESWKFQRLSERSEAARGFGGDRLVPRNHMLSVGDDGPGCSCAVDNLCEATSYSILLVSLWSIGSSEIAVECWSVSDGQSDETRGGAPAVVDLLCHLHVCCVGAWCAPGGIGWWPRWLFMLEALYCRWDCIGLQLWNLGCLTEDRIGLFRWLVAPCWEGHWFVPL